MPLNVTGHCKTQENAEAHQHVAEGAQNLRDGKCRGTALL